MVIVSIPTTSLLDLHRRASLVGGCVGQRRMPSVYPWLQQRAVCHCLSPLTWPQSSQGWHVRMPFLFYEAELLIMSFGGCNFLVSSRDNEDFANYLDYGNPSGVTSNR